MKKISRLFYLAFGLYFMFLAFEPMIRDISDPPQELNYSKTVQLIYEKQIESIKLYSNSPNAEISLKNDEKRYQTSIPSEEAFCQLVQENISQGDDLEITKVKTSKLIYFFYFLLGVFNLRNAFFKYGKKGNNKSIPQKKSTVLDLFDSKVDYSQKLVKSMITFSDVAGLKEEKEELVEVIDFLKNPDKYTKIGAKIPKGILLSGSPGTGKTLLSKAVAGEAGVSFLAVSGAEFDEIYVGLGASRVRELFEEAKRNAPCIIFIDEIDAVGKKRSKSSETSGNYQTLEQLLIEMDGFDKKSNVIVLAATNRPETLDPALVRPGRFDRTIAINLPDVQDREEILKIHGKTKKFFDEVSFSSIAHNTAGFSGAELENLLNESALIAARKGEAAISQKDIDEAFKKVIVGLQKKGRKISEKERKLVAYHEAGHAVVSKFLDTQNNIKEVSIIPRGTAGGYTLHETVEDKSYTSKTELKEKLVTLLGGRAAEQIALNDISTGASNDLEVATNLARSMICVYGMNEEVGPISLESTNNEVIGTETMNLVVKLIAKSVKDAEKEATQILNENRSLLTMVAEALLQKETISGTELDEILKAYKKTIVQLMCD